MWGHKNRKPLSKRQRQCLEARLEHLTAKETAQQLSISPNTVQMHLRAARSKLGAATTLDAALQSRGKGNARGEENGAGSADDRSPHREPGPDADDGQADLLSLFAAAVLFLLFALSLIFIAAWISLLAVETLQLDRSKPFYGLLDRKDR
jgi:DNA-binding CsgD family transcriptional regulator